MRTKQIKQPALSPIKKTPGSRNRTAGHNFERQVVNKLKDIGFEHVSTTRLESKARDDQKIDIMNRNEHANGRLPYNIQCKNTAGTLKYAKVLSELPQGKEINVVFHNQTEKSGTRFNTIGQYAFLNMDDFLDILKELKEAKKELTNRKQ